jgi:hypothetical protein
MKFSFSSSVSYHLPAGLAKSLCKKHPFCWSQLSPVDRWVGKAGGGGGD